MARAGLVLSLVILSWPASFVAGQSLEGTGAVAVGLLLRQMDGVKRVLMIGAHPDDEDTSLLTTLARGWGAETAYLSLTRGDGGQNAIGTELFEGLGVVRTGELEAARRLDGGRQFFARAFDYGFSKTADEALTFWPHEDLLADAVWVIRRFRPHVVVSVWAGTPRDGHGHHQASGIIAREAFDAAGDPTRFPEQLELGVDAWTPAKLYVSDRFGGRAGEPAAETLRIATGDLDPLLGRSLYQLSMESRSQHRSQGMGAPQPPGPRETGVSLVQNRVRGGDGGFFAGIDTTLVGLAGRLTVSDDGGARPVLAVRRGVAQLEAYRAAVGLARSSFGLDMTPVTFQLTEALARLRGAAEDLGVTGDEEPADTASAELRLAFRQRERTATKAFVAAAGIVLDVRAEDDLVVPGQTVRVAVELWNGGDMLLSSQSAELDLPEGWSATRAGVEGVGADGTITPGSLVTWTFAVRVPPDAPPSRLYYLRRDREGAWYHWPDEPDLWGLPRDPSPVSGTVSFVARRAPAAAGTPIELSTDWRYVYVDPTRGELSKNVLVVPAVSVQVPSQSLIWPASSTGARSVSVVVRNEAEGGTSGSLAVSAPAGWTVSPETQPFALDQAGAERSLSFRVQPRGTPTPGQHVFAVEVRGDDSRTYREGYALIDYDHIERAALYQPAEARVTVVPVAVARGLRVGYIMGSGDDGPDAIRQLGVDVSVLDEAQVRAGAFDGFNAIVLGVRAEETRPDLRAVSGQLLDYVRGGGVVVVQYNRRPLGGIAPFPVDVSRGAPRVTDETAQVRLLDPGAPIFTTPNRIASADFDGWVQERGLYFASDWDPAFVPLLEMSDPGEDAARGSLLVASAGEGAYVYTALAFFRQWADGVPGAYRLFANLISLDPAAWRAYATTR